MLQLLVVSPVTNASVEAFGTHVREDIRNALTRQHEGFLTYLQGKKAAACTLRLGGRNILDQVQSDGERLRVWLFLSSEHGEDQSQSLQSTMSGSTRSVGRQDARYDDTCRSRH